MDSNQRKAGGLLGALEDPEEARLVSDLLESLRRLSERMGSAQPLSDALARSVALMPTASARDEYDQLRQELIRYLQTLDIPQKPPGTGGQ